MSSEQALRNPAMPSVSVVIPMFNTARYIGAALDSVLAQTHPVLEVIVVDDGSTDDGAAIVDGYGGVVRCERRPNRGIAATRNDGVALAGGDFLAFLDADDIWTPERIARQFSRLDAGPHVDMLFATVRQFRSPDLPGADLPIPNEVSAGVIAGTLLIRRESFLRVGSFSEDTIVSEFIEWYARAKDAGLSSEILPDILMHRRLHDTNNGIRQRHARSDYARILKGVLDRRRQRGDLPNG